MVSVNEDSEMALHGELSLSLLTKHVQEFAKRKST